jgi:hypothetical protein
MFFMSHENFDRLAGDCWKDGPVPDMTLHIKNQLYEGSIRVHSRSGSTSPLMDSGSRSLPFVDKWGGGPPFLDGVDSWMGWTMVEGVHPIHSIQWTINVHPIRVHSMNRRPTATRRIAFHRATQQGNAAWQPPSVALRAHPYPHPCPHP